MLFNYQDQCEEIRSQGRYAYDFEDKELKNNPYINKFKYELEQELWQEGWLESCNRDWNYFWNMYCKSKGFRYGIFE